MEIQMDKYGNVKHDLYLGPQFSIPNSYLGALHTPLGCMQLLLCIVTQYVNTVREGCSGSV